MHVRERCTCCGTVRRRWALYRLAVEADVPIVPIVTAGQYGKVDPGIEHFARRVGDAAAAEQLRHLLAAAVTEVGNELDQLHARTCRGGRGA